MKFSNVMRLCASIALVGSASLIAACGGGDGAATTSGGANFVLGPVTGGTCTLTSGSGNDPSTYTTVVASTTTAAGSASFSNIPVSGTPLLMTCKGGTYTDETTGKSLTAATFRSWVVPTSGSFTSTVTPFSELAVMLMDKNRKDTTKLKDGTLKNKGPKSPSEYKKAADQIAASFGLKGIDITTIKPTVRGKGGTKLGTSAADKFTLALTALSQRGQKVVKTKSATLKSGTFKAGGIDCTTLDPATNTVDASCVVNDFFSGLGDDGSFSDPSIRGEFASSLTDAANGDPALIDASDLRDVYDESANTDELPSIDYVDANSSTTQMDDSESLIIASGKTSNITIIGQHLKLDPKLIVTLGGSVCDLHDLEKTEAPEVNVEALIASGLSMEDAEAAASKAEEAIQDQLTADCPAKSDGDYPIVVTLKTDDGDEELFEDTITAKVKSAKLKSAAVKTKAFNCTTGVGTCTSTVSGTATGKGPTITVNGGNASLDYTMPKAFNIAGVVVQLLSGTTVLDTTSTDKDGKYSFPNVQDGATFTVRVNAQITNVSAGAPMGSTYNFMVRDNTATNKDMYFVDQACAATTAGMTTTCDVTAGLGTVSGKLLDDTAAGQALRQSAPFSILTVVYSAAKNLQTAYTAPGDNLVMPDLNIYWSPKNINNNDGGKEGGGISTSHYSGGGKLPGVFILGKMGVDTDEFDTGVIGHEFGHYLQAVLSFSDNPGGSHSSGEFKDASLAYGEGYGTAVGGLLTADNKYIDTAGADSIGGITDLNVPIALAKNPGFYSEDVVGYVMYQIGSNAGGKYPGGFTAVWNAVKAFKGNGDSATIFAFLSRYIAQNAATGPDVIALASGPNQNINTVDAKGANNPPDSKIDATASAGKDGAATGANDLGKLFATVNAPVASTVAGTTTVATSEGFCVNRNLKGASNGNGLGMSKRFSFTPSFTGSVGLKPLDDKNKDFNEQQTSISVRDAMGNKAGIFVWDGGYGKISVVSGREYTVVVNAADPNGIFQGNRCGNTLALYQLAP